MAIRVGRWDCAVCGTKGNLGPETKCKNCGSSRPQNVRFYLPTDEEIVEDVSKIKEAKAGVDWICGHCTSQNKAKDLLCHACGNPRDELSEDIDLKVRDYDTKEIPRDGTREEDVAGETLRRARTKPGYKREKPKGLLGKILAVPALAGILFFLLQTFPNHIEVDAIGFRWERWAQYEVYEAVAKEEWSTPPGAFDVQSFRAIHHYDKQYVRTETRTRTVKEKVGEERYVCGKRDLGNGYFEDRYCTRPIYRDRQEQYQHDVYKDVPVYRTKYKFKVNEWVRKSENLLTASGTEKNAAWPDPGHRTNPQKWRENTASRKASYFVIVREDDGDEHEEEISESRFQAINKGDKLKAKRSYLLDIWYGLEE